MEQHKEHEGYIAYEQQGAHMRITLCGTWHMSQHQPDVDTFFRLLPKHAIRSTSLHMRDLARWDSTLLAFVVRLVRYGREHSISVDVDALPEGLQKMVHMAFAVPAKDGSVRIIPRHGFLTRVGIAVLAVPEALYNVLDFIGQIAVSLGRFFTGNADVRGRDVLAAMQECGVDALPIISITTLLFGLILAFVGAVQLTQFGAEIYVAGLVGIGVLRVMGAVMVGIVMSGRMGAAYAALIGSMQVNEEVDALTTFGISPIDFLVLPRVLALLIMTPLLTLYADFMGLLGGLAVGVLMLDVGAIEYINATFDMVPFRHVLVGLVYSTFFGIVVAVAGCYQGIRCGRSAEAVGKSTTAAVVNSIVGIIVVTAIITILCSFLKI